MSADVADSNVDFAPDCLLSAKINAIPKESLDRLDLHDGGGWQFPMSSDR